MVIDNARHPVVGGQPAASAAQPFVLTPLAARHEIDASDYVLPTAADAAPGFNKAYAAAASAGRPLFVPAGVYTVKSPLN